MRRGILEDNTGQVSAELIVVIAALLAVAMIFVSSLMDTVTDARGQMDEETKEVLDAIKNIR